MGNSGSYTAKASIQPCLFVFTKWGNSEIKEFLFRGQQELPETFALRKHEFEFLLGQDMVDFHTSRTLFQDIFDLDRNSLVDKFEVMCVVCLTSKVDNQEKIHFFFDLFNFNNKGYLFESELTLLLLAVSRGVFKADQKYLPPNNKTIAHLVKEAFLHAKVDSSSIRKPELVNFALGNPEVLSFLESWRGHASQVLLNSDEKWRDLTFPCTETAIIPSHDWLKLGFPSGKFVKWYRREKAGTGVLGYVEIFTHELSYLKTVDRRIVYSGEGVLGRGTLRQGLLADRWFLNALAAMTGRPDAVLACLASTGQEEKGRFCTRFFEGSGWRSVNVDDRVPCSPDGNPIFATSSHSLEAWPMLLEKGLAKYLGCYGNIGMCGKRGDANEAALRLLTGGHVQKYHTKDFDWRSVEDDVVGQSGTSFVKKCLAEGSLISFGRSESMALMQQNVVFPAGTARAIPAAQPFGRLFPVVGHIVIKGYHHLILRDAYGLIGDCDLNVNYESGHSRTFKLKVEDLAFVYDTIVVSRFPDSLRVIAEKIRLKPWRSEVISHDTKGPRAPAKFLLTVSKSASNGIRLNPIRRMGDPAANITAVLNESDGKVVSELAKVMTLREKVDFSRVKLTKESFQAAADNVRADRGMKEKEGVTPLAEVPAKKARRRSSITMRAGKDEVDAMHESVDISLTFSSSCDWTYAGSEEAGPKIRVRITPTPDTLMRLKERDRQIEAVRRQIRELAEARKAAAIRLELELAAAAEVAGEDVEHDNHTVDSATIDDSTMDNTAVEIGKIIAGASAKALIVAPIPTGQSEQVGMEDSTSPPMVPDLPKEVSDRVKYDVTLSAERCWISRNLNLFPGDYFVLADVSYSVPYEDAFNMTIPAHLSEAPWLDSKHPSNAINNPPTDPATKSFNRRSSSAIVTTSSGHSKSKLVIPAGMGLGASDGPATASSNRVGDLDGAPDLSKMPQIWLHASSLEAFEVKAIGKKDLPFGYNPTVEDIPVEPEKWPFSSESQGDASSRGLQNMLTTAKTDAQMVGLQFTNLANQYKEERKKQLLKSQNI